MPMPMASSTATAATAATGSCSIFNPSKCSSSSSYSNTSTFSECIKSYAQFATCVKKYGPWRHGWAVRALSGSEEDDEISRKVQTADWRSFRARLVQKTASTDTITREGIELWAHAIAKPETGCLLLANPTAFLTSQQYFHQAVIFLFAHSNEGSAGLILNRPTEYNLGQLAGFEELLPEFSSCPLYMGGDVGANALHVVHGVHGLRDSVEVIPGVNMGGLKAMKESVQSGESKPSDYRWFVRYAGWGPGQLEKEVGQGVWYLASSSKDVILKPCIRLPKPLWREVLEYMGDPYDDISRRAYGEI